MKELKILSPLNILNLMTKFNIYDLYPDPYSCVVITLLDAFNIASVSVCHVMQNVKDMNLRAAHFSVAFF